MREKTKLDIDKKEQKKCEIRLECVYMKCKQRLQNEKKT